MSSWNVIQIIKVQKDSENKNKAALPVERPVHTKDPTFGKNTHSQMTENV